MRISFFSNDTATTEIYTLSLHDALPISLPQGRALLYRQVRLRAPQLSAGSARPVAAQEAQRLRRAAARESEGQAPLRRSEEHTSELQSRRDLVCRLLLEKKKTTRQTLNS